MHPRSKIFPAIALLVLVALPAVAAPPASPPPVEFNVSGTPAPSAAGLPLEGFKGVGMMFVKNNRLDRLGWTEAEIAAFVAGVHAALRGEALGYDDATRRVGADMVRRVRELDQAKPAVTGSFAQPGKLDSYLKEIKKRLRMQESDSGLLYLVKTVGRGARPTPNDTVVITLAGAGAEGDKALPAISGENVRIKVADLLPGLREGVQMLAVGSDAVFVLPPALSFGEGEWPEGVERGQPLTFALTLHEVIAAGR